MFERRWSHAWARRSGGKGRPLSLGRGRGAEERHRRRVSALRSRCRLGDRLSLARYMSRRNGTSAFVPMSARSRVAMGPAQHGPVPCEMYCPPSKAPLLADNGLLALRSLSPARRNTGFCLIIYRVVRSNHCRTPARFVVARAPGSGELCMPSHTTGPDSPDLSTRLIPFWPGIEGLVLCAVHGQFCGLSQTKTALWAWPAIGYLDFRFF